MRLVFGMTLAVAALAADALAKSAHAAIPASERQALVDFYTATEGPGWSDDEGWLGTAGSECTWYGITCDAAQAHVTEIRLDTNSLGGTLPSLVGLPLLQYFDVDSNSIGGTLPPLASLEKLRFFHAEFNRFTGTLPALAGLAQLESFDAAYNELRSSRTASMRRTSGVVQAAVPFRHGRRGDTREGNKRFATVEKLRR